MWCDRHWGQSYLVKRQDLLGQIASFQHRRPDAEEVASLWQHVMDIWEFLSGEERTELIGLLVEEVTMVKKQKAAVRLNLTSGSLQVRNFEPHGCGRLPRFHNGCGSQRVRHSPFGRFSACQLNSFRRASGPTAEADRCNPSKRVDIGSRLSPI